MYKRQHQDLLTYGAQRWKRIGALADEFAHYWKTYIYQIGTDKETTAGLSGHEGGKGRVLSIYLNVDGEIRRQSEATEDLSQRTKTGQICPPTQSGTKTRQSIKNTGDQEAGFSSPDSRRASNIAISDQALSNQTLTRSQQPLSNGKN